MNNETGIIRCPQCGTENYSNQPYCYKCKALLHAPPGYAQGAPEQGQQQYYPPPPQQQYYQQPPVAQKKSGCLPFLGGLGVGLILIVLVCVGIAVVGVIALTSAARGIIPELERFGTAIATYVPAEELERLATAIATSMPAFPTPVP